MAKCCGAGSVPPIPNSISEDLDLEPNEVQQLMLDKLAWGDIFNINFQRSIQGRMMMTMSFSTMWRHSGVHRQCSEIQENERSVACADCTVCIFCFRCDVFSHWLWLLKMQIYKYALKRVVYDSDVSYQHLYQN